MSSDKFPRCISEHAMRVLRPDYRLVRSYHPAYPSLSGGAHRAAGFKAAEQHHVRRRRYGRQKPRWTQHTRKTDTTSSSAKGATGVQIPLSAFSLASLFQALRERKGLQSGIRQAGAHRSNAALKASCARRRRPCHGPLPHASSVASGTQRGRYTYGRISSLQEEHG